MGDGGIVGSQRPAIDFHPGASHRVDWHRLQAGQYTGPHTEEQQISTASRHLGSASPEDVSLARALALVRFLREHCEWDARQTSESLVPYLLEEAHEVADAIRRGDDAELSSELGDLLLNVAFQVVLAQERGAFGAERVVTRLEEKMIERHPHIYGDAEEAPDWEEMKARQRAGTVAGSGTTSARADDPLAGISAGLEPLSRALRVQERAAGVGFDWPSVDGAIDKVREELCELESLVEGKAVSPSSAGAAPPAAVVDEAGDLLFAAVNVCRLAGVHPMTALAGATEKFSRRFRAVAERARASGIDMAASDLRALDELWDAVKETETRGPE